MGNATGTNGRATSNADAVAMSADRNSALCFDVAHEGTNAISAVVINMDKTSLYFISTLSISWTSDTRPIEKITSIIVCIYEAISLRASGRSESYQFVLSKAEVTVKLNADCGIAGSV